MPQAFAGLSGMLSTSIMSLCYFTYALRPSSQKQFSLCDQARNYRVDVLEAGFLFCIAPQRDACPCTGFFQYESPGKRRTVCCDLGQRRQGPTYAVRHPAAEAGKPCRAMSMQTHFAYRLLAPCASSNSVQKQCVVQRHGQIESTG